MVRSNKRVVALGGSEAMQRDPGLDFSWRDLDYMAPLWQILSALERLSSLHPLSIFSRKRLDISFFPDISRAVRLCLEAMLLPGRADGVARAQASLDVSHCWLPARADRRKRFREGQAPSALREDEDGGDGGGDDGAASRLAATVAPFLSVRTAFDLYLKALDLPRGSRVICSALTIPHMVDIFEEHGLVPVPVDLDPDTLAPEAGALEAEVERHRPRGCGERRVRAIYVAHVFGAQVDMTPIAELAKRDGLLLWEDCAQVFTGLQGYLGHPDSDALFFSFGVIKRASALGGGVVLIKDTAILADMLQEETGYPAQSASTYLRRVVKCSLLLACTSPLLYGVIVHALRLVGVDHDKVVMKLSKGFPKDGLLKAIRHRPSVPMLQMLAWRISRYTPDGVEVRLRHCNRMLALLEAALPQQPQPQQQPRSQSQPRPPQGLGGSQHTARESVFEVLPGLHAHRHTLWLCPVMVKGGPEAADVLVKDLLREGFDATRAPTSLMPIERCTAAGRQAPSSSVSPCATPRCSGMMDSLVYLPLSNNVPDSEVDRMALALARALSGGSSVRQEERHRVCAGPLPRRGNRRGEVARSLMAFALRLDMIVVSAASAMLLVLLLLLARLLL